MKLNKEKFLKSELGGKLQECVAVWDYWLAKINESYETRTDVERYQAQWEVFQTVLRQFYNVEYHFTRRILFRLWKWKKDCNSTGTDLYELFR